MPSTKKRQGRLWAISWCWVFSSVVQSYLGLFQIQRFRHNADIFSNRTFSESLLSLFCYFYCLVVLALSNSIHYMIVSTRWLPLQGFAPVFFDCSTICSFALFSPCSHLLISWHTGRTPSISRQHLATLCWTHASDTWLDLQSLALRIRRRRKKKRAFVPNPYCEDCCAQDTEHQSCCLLLRLGQCACVLAEVSKQSSQFCPRTPTSTLVRIFTANK